MSFTDLTVNVGGVPITISRTYDSLDSAAEGDFGYGWTMDFAQAKVQTSVLDAGSGRFSPISV